MKNTNPAKFLKGKSVSAMLQLYFHITHLKQIFRSGWLVKGRRIPRKQCESVAEHICSMTLLALFVCDTHFPKLNKHKVVTMCLLHDLAEIIEGDKLPRHTKQQEDNKYRRERVSILVLLRRLPKCNQYLKLWEEFEAARSPEAQFVKQIDKLETVLQAKIYALQHGRNVEDFFMYAKPYLKSPQLLALLDEARAL